MKHLFYLIIILPTLLFSQSKDCVYDMNQKTDSTSIKVLPEQLIHERIYGNSKEIIQFKLLNNDDTPLVNVQLLQKNTDFIPASCFNKSSRIVFQLANGKIVTLVSITDDSCSILNYNELEKSNIRILDGYFAFAKNNYEELKKSPISLMRIQFAGEAKEYVIKKELQSEFLNKTYYPDNIFISFLKCIE
jgi:hypothetical protein